MADDKTLSDIDEELDDDKPAKAEKKSDKDEKAAKKKGPGAGQKMGKYFRDAKGEFKKIIWPTRKEVVHNTGVTLAMCLILGLAVSLFDLGLGALVRLITNL